MDKSESEILQKCLGKREKLRLEWSDTFLNKKLKAQLQAQQLSSQNVFPAAFGGGVSISNPLPHLRRYSTFVFNRSHSFVLPTSEVHEIYHDRKLNGDKNGWAR